MSVDGRLRLELTPTQIGHIRAALRHSQLSLVGPGCSFANIEVAALLAEINEQVVEQTCRENNIPAPTQRARGSISTEGYDDANIDDFFDPDPYQEV